MGDTVRPDFDQDTGKVERVAAIPTVDPTVYDDTKDTLVAVQELLRVDFLALLIAAEDGQEFVPVASIGYPHDRVQGFRLNRRTAAETQLRPQLTPVVVEEPAAYPHLSPLGWVPGVRNVTIVPLVLGGRLRGILHLGNREERPAGNGDVRLLEFAGHSVALAVDRAEVRQAEVRAQETADLTRDHLTFLAIAGSLLSASLDYETTLSQITGMLVPRLADVCSVVLLDDDGTVNQITIDAVDPDIARIVRAIQTRYSLRPDSRSSVRHVLDTGQTVFHPFTSDDYLEQTAADADHLELLRHFSMRSMVVVPLNSRERTIGALSIAYTTGDRHYSLDEVNFIEELAHRAALAVENARLYQESQRALEEREELLRFREETLLVEHEARAQAEAAQRREAFLSEASSVLSTSLDYTATLENLARLVVSRFTDWCTIELFDDSGVSSLVAAAHASPEGDAVLSQMRDEYLPTTIPELPPRHVLRYREATLISDLPDGFWSDSVSTSEHMLQLNELNTTSLIVIPLLVRDRILGVMVLGRSNGTKPFDDDDVRMAIDLGHRAALATENSFLYSRAQRIVQQQEEFISTASHELKTPLTTVKGYLQLINRQILREDFSPERIVRFTRELDGQVRRLEDLVSDLLDVSRIQQGRMELRLERFDVVELASSVLSRFEHAPERRPNHELSITAPEPIEGTWDRGRLDQVLTNLISNALKYSPEGGQVLVHVRRVNESVHILVRDNGIGIGQDEKARLFQPFARGQGLSLKISGTGLGLYIARRIVQSHNGTIFVKSRPGQGTTFTVQLPLTIDSNSQ